jgi:hypothetical protein
MRTKKRQRFDWFGWRTHVHGLSPQQTNGFDCGVFMCQCLRGLMTGSAHPFPFDQSAMPTLRLQMVHELLRNELTPRAAAPPAAAPDPPVRTRVVDCAAADMRQALAAARRSAGLDMRAMASYHQFFFPVGMPDDHWGVLYADLHNRRLAWLDSDVRRATHGQNFNLMRGHVDRYLSGPVREFLDRLWAEARRWRRGLHEHPWGREDDPGPPSVTQWPLCSIWGQALTYSSWRPDEQHTPDAPDPASAAGRIPPRPADAPPPTTHKQLRLHGVPQQRTADGGVLALLALRTLAETRPAHDGFTPRRLQHIASTGVCHFPHPARGTACWQCHHYAARMEILRANMVVELHKGMLFQLPPSCSGAWPRSGTDQRPGAMPTVLPERDHDLDTAWRAARTAHTLATGRAAAAQAAYRSAAADAQRDALRQLPQSTTPAARNDAAADSQPESVAPRAVDLRWATWTRDRTAKPAARARLDGTARRVGADGLTPVDRYAQKMDDAARLIDWSADPEEAKAQAEAFMATWFYGQDTLVLRSFEYADDQKMFEAMERIPHLNPLRYIQEQLLARQVELRLETFEKGAYTNGGLIIEMSKCWVQWSQAPLTCPGPITEAEVEALNTKYRCAGCDRAEVSQLGCWAHERTCPYCVLVSEWTNTGCDSGGWKVIALLAVLGPPEHRFWKVHWAPVTGAPTERADTTPPAGQIDTGGFACGWEPQHHLDGCKDLMLRFWKAHPHLRRQDVVEHLDADRQILPRCSHCNRLNFDTADEHTAHVLSCPYRPKQRTRSSTNGRAVIAARKVAAQARWPTVTVRGRDGKMHDLANKLHLLYLGHLASADTTTTTDMESRMRMSTAGFWRVQHLWRHPDISPRDKLRMFRRFLMQLVYAGHVAWCLDDDAQRALNYWTASKVRIITGRTLHEELGRRTIDTVMTLRYWRRRYLGEVLRAHRNDPRKQELCPHAELVRKRRLPRHGGIMMDAPPYDSVPRLMELAGYFAPVMLEAQRDGRDTQRGIANLRRRARGERNERDWRAQDLALRPEYGDADDDTEDEYDAETGEPVADIEAKNLLSAEEKAAKEAHEKHATETEIHDALVAAAGQPTWLVFHDGGYTGTETEQDRAQTARRRNAAAAAGKPEDPRDRARLGAMAPAKAGWGYWARYYDIAPGMVKTDPWPNGASPLIFGDKSYGPVQLDETLDDFSGCVDLSNNTGELSAIPQVLIRMMRWRRWRQNEADMARRGYEHLPLGRPTSLILVYDSKYTYDMCVSHKPARCNATVIGLCRRLLEDAELANIHVTWVKVRGHSDNTGNDMADDAATRGMNGGKKYVMPVARYVNDLLGRAAWCSDPADAAHDRGVLDAVSEAEAQTLAGGTAV